MDLSVLHNVTYGMYAVCADDSGRPAGCIINTFMQITSKDPVVSICLNKNNYTYDVIKRTNQFTVSILSTETNRNVIAYLGFSSGRENDKFKDISYKKTPGGLPYLTDGCCGILTCRVLSEIDQGTHMLIIAQLTDAQKLDAAEPMTYAYYHKVIKGSAPENAPTYQPPQAKKEGVYVCDICSYEFEGDLDSMPDDFICPICKASKAHFKKKN